MNHQTIMATSINGGEVENGGLEGAGLSVAGLNWQIERSGDICDPGNCDQPVVPENKIISNYNATAINDNNHSINRFQDIGMCDADGTAERNRRNELKLKHLQQSASSKIKQYKLKIYSEVTRIYSNRGPEKLFAKYWEYVSLYLSSSIGDDDFLLCGDHSVQKFHPQHQILSFFKSFLKTKTLRRCHNRLILALMEDVTNQSFIPRSTIAVHAPIHLKERILSSASSSVPREQNFIRNGSIPDNIRRTDVVECSMVYNSDEPTKEYVCSLIPNFHNLFGNNSGAYDLLENCMNSQISSTALVDEESFNTLESISSQQNQQIQSTILPSASLPGLLSIQPRVKKYAGQQGLKVSEDAVKFICVATRDYAVSTLRQSIELDNMKRNDNPKSCTKGASKLKNKSRSVLNPFHIAATSSLPSHVGYGISGNRLAWERPITYLNNQNIPNMSSSLYRKVMNDLDLNISHADEEPLATSKTRIPSPRSQSSKLSECLIKPEGPLSFQNNMIAQNQISLKGAGGKDFETLWLLSGKTKPEVTTENTTRRKSDSKTIDKNAQRPGSNEREKNIFADFIHDDDSLKNSRSPAVVGPSVQMAAIPEPPIGNLSTQNSRLFSNPQLLQSQLSLANQQVLYNSLQNNYHPQRRGSGNVGTMSLNHHPQRPVSRTGAPITMNPVIHRPGSSNNTVISLYAPLQRRGSNGAVLPKNPTPQSYNLSSSQGNLNSLSNISLKNYQRAPGAPIPDLMGQAGIPNYMPEQKYNPHHQGSGLSQPLSLAPPQNLHMKQREIDPRQYQNFLISEGLMASELNHQVLKNSNGNTRPAYLAGKINGVSVPFVTPYTSATNGPDEVNGVFKKSDNATTK